MRMRRLGDGGRKTGYLRHRAACKMGQRTRRHRGIRSRGGGCAPEGEGERLDIGRLG